MEQISWEADSSSASHEIPRMLRNPKFHTRVHKSPPLCPRPEPHQLRARLLILLPYISIHILIYTHTHTYIYIYTHTHTHTYMPRSPKRCCAFGLSHQYSIHAFPSYPCSIISLISGEQNKIKLLFKHFCQIFCRLSVGSNTFLSTLSSKNIIPLYALTMTPSFTPTLRNTQYYRSVYFNI